MSEQPEALRLADALDAQVQIGGGDLSELEDAAAELRRPHAQCERMREDVLQLIACHEEPTCPAIGVALETLDAYWPGRPHVIEYEDAALKEPQ